MLSPSRNEVPRPSGPRVATDGGLAGCLVHVRTAGGRMTVGRYAREAVSA